MKTSLEVFQQGQLLMVEPQMKQLRKAMENPKLVQSFQPQMMVGRWFSKGELCGKNSMSFKFRN